MANYLSHLYQYMYRVMLLTLGSHSGIYLEAGCTPKCFPNRFLSQSLRQDFLQWKNMFRWEHWYLNKIIKMHSEIKIIIIKRLLLLLLKLMDILLCYSRGTRWEQLTRSDTRNWYLIESCQMFSFLISYLEIVSNCKSNAGK